MLTGTKVEKYDGKTLYVSNADGSRAIDVDNVILSTGFRSNDRLFKEINSTVPKKVWLLGDAKKPANVMFAIKDGNAVGRVL